MTGFMVQLRHLTVLAALAVLTHGREEQRPHDVSGAGR
jgi:hypothetical protein